MVRFIMNLNKPKYYLQIFIYIPIWLDLLWTNLLYQKENKINLHSNMVRFIMQYIYKKLDFINLFTFQYG